MKTTNLANKENRLPNFLVIGPPKCATSWLYTCLREHPDIYLPFIKEIHFFDLYYEKGLDWYKRYFNLWNEQKAAGEITPSYIYGGETARRIAKDLKDVRLIAVLRNPVDRAYSHYCHHIRKGMVTTDFETALENNPKYVEQGFYFSHLEQYFAVFPREKFLILIYDDIENDARAFLRQIFRFLEVGEDFLPKFTYQKLPPELLSAPVYNWVSQTSRFLRNKMGLGSLIDAIKKPAVLSYADRVFDKFSYAGKNLKSGAVKESPAMKLATRERLLALFHKENEKLAAFLGRDLSAWCSHAAKG